MIHFLEAGHNKWQNGYLDKGVSVKLNGRTIYEADEALEFQATLKWILENEHKNQTVYIARSGDETPSLASRIAEANAVKADRFISLHFDMAKWGWRWGCYHADSRGSAALATRVSRALDPINGPIGTWLRRHVLSRQGGLYINGFKRGPAILIELGPIRDMNREERLRYARAIAKELVK